jgi:pyrimidine-nucleoside phosphorylase
MRMCDLIYKKRNGEKLSSLELNFIVSGYTKCEIPDYQMSAFLMAVFFRGMEPSEVSDMTKFMAESGEIYDLSDIKGIKVDKHSTGGVGDGVSIALAPVVASCGVCVPMMSGRALGHTGGTLDKLESIPGFRVDLTFDEFKHNLEKIHLAMIGQTDAIAPADKKIYALRDVTATVASIPLICASILSKKIAEGCDALLLDVKVGNGAFMCGIEEARALAKALTATGAESGKNIKAVITDMNQPLGNAVGNALEVRQAIDILKGKGPADISELVLELASRMLIMAKAEHDHEKARARAKKVIDNSKALSKLEDMIVFQGGDPETVEYPERVLPKARNRKDVFTAKEGYLDFVDTRKVGISAMVLGAGRQKTEDRIDYGSGIILHRKRGDKVGPKEPVATFYYNDGRDFELAKNMFEESYVVSESKPKPRPLVYEEI